MRRKRVPARKIRILIADREGVFRIGLKKVFALEDDLRVVAQAQNSIQLVAMAKAFKPDLLYVQAEIAEEGRGDLLPRVRSLLPRAKMIVTGAKLSDEDTSRYLKGGAAGVIAKSAQPALFVKSARKVMDNELWLPKSQVARLAQLLEGAQERPRRPAETLTRQEKIVITYLIQGCRNREIARHLSITEQTVKNHLRTIYDKVGVSDRLELVLYAIHQRLELPALQPAEALP